MNDSTQPPKEDTFLGAVTNFFETKCSSQTTRTGISCENVTTSYFEGHSMETIAAEMTESTKGKFVFTADEIPTVLKIYAANKSCTAFPKKKVRQLRKSTKKSGSEGGFLPA